MKRSLFVIVLLAGGASTRHSDAGLLPWKCPKPTRMVLLLSPSELQNNGSLPQQGIMCRVYFFHENDPSPLQVKGAVAFTAYDRAKGKEGAAALVGVFEVPADQLATHHRKDIVGHSYLFWLPYTPSEQTQIVIQGKFRTRKGAELASSLVSVDLTPAVLLEDSTSAHSYSVAADGARNGRAIDVTTLPDVKRRSRPVPAGRSRATEPSRLARRSSPIPKRATAPRRANAARGPVIPSLVPVGN